MGEGQRALREVVPGIGVAAAESLIKQDPMLLGSDNWPVEVAPNPDPQISLPVHQIALVVNGVHQEFFRTHMATKGRELAEACLSIINNLAEVA